MIFPLIYFLMTFLVRKNDRKKGCGKMERIIPSLYAEYARKINYDRAIPKIEDCLLPSERRLLLSLRDLAVGKTVKSAKIVGHCIGNYHPHGDNSTYMTLVKLVNRGYCIKQGNFGNKGLMESPPAAMRYTECGLKKSIYDVYFKYTSEIETHRPEELEEEPLFITGPVPLGLIGNDIMQGIAIHTVKMPRYRFSDLIKRLQYLLKPEKYEKHNPVPNFENCTVEGQIEEIFTKGNSEIVITPNYEVKGNKMYITGYNPLGFDKLINFANRNDGVYLKDLTSKGKIRIEVSVKRGSYSLLEKIINDVLKTKLTTKQNFVKEETIQENTPLDDVLKLSYYWYFRSVCSKTHKDILSDKITLVEYIILLEVKNIIRSTKSKITSVDQIIEVLRNKNFLEKVVNEITKTFGSDDVKIDYNDVYNILSRRSVKSLIESEYDINKIMETIREKTEYFRKLDKILIEELNKLPNID